MCISVQSLVDMAPKYILEQFLEAELLVNITEHQVNASHFPAKLDICWFASIIIIYCYELLHIRYLSYLSAIFFSYLYLPMLL